MSQSQTNINKQLMSLTPDAIVELFEIDFSIMQENFEQLSDLYGINIGADTVYRFCGMINGTNPIVWRGKSYQPLPISAQGFEHKNDGRLPRPSLAIANPEGIFSKILKNNDDFVNCKVTRKRTYVRFLDDENFQNRGLNSDGKNPFGSSDKDSYLPDDVYYINRKISETKDLIQFELTSPLELKSCFVPARRITSNFCSWTYRCEIGCGYKGLPIETSNGKSLTSGFAFLGQKDIIQKGFVNTSAYPDGLDDIPEWNKYGNGGSASSLTNYQLGDVVKIIAKGSKNPYRRVPNVFVCIQSHSSPADHHPFLDKEYWLKDECQKSLSSCKKRFSNDELSDFNKKDKTYPGLRFGGFPGVHPYPIE